MYISYHVYIRIYQYIDNFINKKYLKINKNNFFQILAHFIFKVDSSSLLEKRMLFKFSLKFVNKIIIILFIENVLFFMIVSLLLINYYTIPYTHLAI